MKEILWPDYRSNDYAIWQACARFGVKPPGVKANWDDMGSMNQARLYAYNQVALHDEDQRDATLAGVSRAY